MKLLLCNYGVKEVHIFLQGVSSLFSCLSSLFAQTKILETCFACKKITRRRAFYVVFQSRITLYIHEHGRRPRVVLETLEEGFVLKHFYLFILFLDMLLW